ncbi:hypothetical protein N7481_010367 [Penicillium waksmanii]|uniref:uncharacterized protein n=1 Tax=Penicillium waksmanii TaxID=69791 RepID=UPI002548DE77|nr:uncharacterized protein N7481_010367 [Penicillium waksmanii]KAJ5973157.1 hypothetical protein N7481_010367 [Penicillium waksmanii]
MALQLGHTWNLQSRTGPARSTLRPAAIVYTFGGLATDTETRVLTQQGAIPNLYAAGEITGHFHDTAPNAVAVLRALVFGRIAGLNAMSSK